MPGNGHARFGGRKRTSPRLVPRRVADPTRHLVKDRMDITGARWGLPGAEAILKLRALRSNGDFDAYWRYHLDQERRRAHESRYLNGLIPQAA